MGTPVDQLRRELVLARQRQAEAEQEAQQADTDAQKFEEALLRAKQELKALKAAQQQAPSPQAAPSAATEELRRELGLARSEAKRLSQDLRVAHARIDLLEERIFEANQAAERAEQDAVEADKDAIMFEKHARSHEAKYHEACDEIAALKTKLEALTSETARLRAENQRLTQQQRKEQQQQQRTSSVSEVTHLTPPPKPQRRKSGGSGSGGGERAGPTKPSETHALPKPRAASTHLQPSSVAAATARSATARNSSVPPPKVAPKQRPSVSTSKQSPKSISEATATMQAPAPARVKSSQGKEQGSLASDRKGQLTAFQKARSAIPTSTRVRRVEPTGAATAGATTASGGGFQIKQKKKKTGKEAMLAWCQTITQSYKDVNITNFSSSFADGMAFVAMIHHYFPSTIDLTKHSPDTQRENFTVAFKVADEKGGVYPLLDVEDMVTMSRPDALSVMTYVSQLHKQLAKHG